jgi:hypothetical protein
MFYIESGKGRSHKQREIIMTNKTKTTKTYNGHKNKNYWNVSLWINNDSSLYQLAKEFISYNSNRNDAARDMMLHMEALGQDTTPDGFKYSKSSIRAAMVGM